MTMVKCDIGKDTKIGEYVDGYCCMIGDNCKIGSFTIIEGDVKIGNNVIIKGHCYIPTGVLIGDDVFIGQGTKFINDKHPKVKNKVWMQLMTRIREGASIGANCTILCGIIVGKDSEIGAGSVVTKDVEDNSTVYGNPAKTRKEWMKEYGLH